MRSGRIASYTTCPGRAAPGRQVPIPRNRTSPRSVVTKEKLMAGILDVLFDVIDVFNLVTWAAERLGVVSTGAEGEGDPIPRRAWWPAPRDTSKGVARPAPRGRSQASPS